MVTITGLQGVPIISKACDLPQILVETVKKEHFQIAAGDIICVTSKICSMADGNIVDLSQVAPTSVAKRIHQRIPRKDASLIQVIIDQTADPSDSKLEISENHIGAWLPNGLFLTSGGVDKGKNNTAIILPQNCDLTAKHISNTFYQELGVKTSVIITDSDGRIDKKGANQIAVGLYGLNGLRINKEAGTAETLCDLLAAAAGLVMGQRGINIPLACIHGLEYDQNTDSGIGDIVN